MFNTTTRRRLMMVCGLALLVIPVFGCSKPEEAKPANGNYFTGDLATKPKGSATPKGVPPGGGGEK